MARLNELRETRAARVAEMRGLVDAAETAKRDLSQEEQARFDALKGEVRGLEAQIGRAETLAEYERRADAEPVTRHGGMAELEQRYSIGRAIAEFAETGRLTGAEGEFAREHRSGRQGGFSAPVSAFLGESRAVLTTQPAAGPGGNLISTSLGPLIDRPRPQLQVQRLGASVLSGLSGMLDLPRIRSSGQVGWVGEHEAGPQSDPTFDRISMAPHTCSGSYELSRRMLIQAPQIEQILRNDIGLLLAEALDQAAVLAPGTGNFPRGVKATPGVRKITSAFDDPARPSIEELDAFFGGMVGLVETSNIGGSTGFLAHPLVKSTLNQYRGADGSLIGLQGFLQGEPAAFSTQIPANGGANTNLAHIFYGNWSDLIIGYWSSVDIVLNPYADSVAKKGGAYLHAFLDADVAVRHAESFVFADNFPVFAPPTTSVVAA